MYFDVATALSDPAHLDSLSTHAPAALNVDLAEESSACWLSDDRVTVGSSDEGEAPEVAAEQADAPRLVPLGVAIFDVPSRRYVKSFKLSEPPGTMMRVGETQVVSFYRQPSVPLGPMLGFVMAIAPTRTVRDGPGHQHSPECYAPRRWADGFFTNYFTRCASRRATLSVAKGCSGTWIDHEVSQRTHKSLGCEVVDRCVHFKKAL